jgi:hypothetical protein
MKIQDSYKEKMSAQLKEWGAEIDVLEAKVGSVNADLKVKRAEAIRGLRIKQRAASAKMTELNAATGEAWDKVKETADKLWDDLKTGLSAAHDKFR